MASPAKAYPSLGSDPEKIARVHCQLLVHAAGDSRPVTAAFLDEMAGEAGFAARAGMRSTDDLQLLTQGQPDMGFVVGDRWMFATRNDQAVFNALFTQAVVKRFGLRAPAPEDGYGKTCIANVHIAQKKQKGSPELPPERRTLTAMARILAPKQGAQPAVLIYNMEKKPFETWRILDLFIDNVGLAYTYQPQFNEVLARGGYKALAAELASGQPQPNK